MRTRLMVAAGLWAGLVAVLPATVHAMQGGRMGPSGPTGSMGPTGSVGMPDGRRALDWACVRDCGDYALTCRRTVEESERLCTVATCNDEARRAIDVCRTAPRSIDCRQARLALRQCVLTCLETATGDNTSCRSEGVACLQNCPPSADLARKEPGCVGGCASDFTECLPIAGNCDCNNDYECLAQCDDTLQADRRGCIRAAQSCVAGCPDVTPSTGQ